MAHSPEFFRFSCLFLLLSVPKPHYASKQSGAQLHPPHGREATVPKKQRPCPRSSGRSCGELREETPTAEDNETETVTLLTTHTRTYTQSVTLQRKGNLGQISQKSGRRELVIETTNHLRRELANEKSSQALPHNFFFFLSHTLREGGACPGLESRGGERASNMHCKLKYPNLPAYCD